MYRMGDDLIERKLTLRMVYDVDKVEPNGYWMYKRSRQELGGE